MHSNILVRLIYTAFIGILFATLVGAGIAAFYPQPEPPRYPEPIQPSKLDANGVSVESAEDLAARQKYQKQDEQFQKDLKVYNRNVSIITLIIAILALAISLTFLKNLEIISDGLLVGGISTLLYSIILGFETDDKFRFLVVAIGFIISIIIGYLKFVRPAQKEQIKL